MKPLKLAITLHKDVTERLVKINPNLANQARAVLEVNKSERHIRGGMATKEKYMTISNTGVVKKY
jgi:putative DeoR family transcriptional regulator (stage III sporulation protein D)